MTPPDSGEREVCGAVVARVNGDPLACDKAPDHDGPHTARLAEPLAAHGAVVLPVGLAQRILAALVEQSYRCSDNGRPKSAEHLSALADELRAAMPGAGEGKP